MNHIKRRMRKRKRRIVMSYVQPGLHREFQASLGYKERGKLCFHTFKNKRRVTEKVREMGMLGG